MTLHSLLLLIQQADYEPDAKLVISAPNDIFDKLVELLDQLHQLDDYISINNYYKNCFGLCLSKENKDSIRSLIDKLVAITGWRYDTETNVNSRFLTPSESSPVQIHTTDVTFPVSKVVFRVWDEEQPYTIINSIV